MGHSQGSGPPEDNTLFRFFNDSHSHEDAVDILHTEYTITLWLLRALGFILMFVGLMLIGKPLAAVSNILPVIGDAGYFLYGVAAFFITLILTILTIIISTIIHNIYLLVGVLVLIALIAFYVIKKKQTPPDDSLEESQ